MQPKTLDLEGIPEPIARALEVVAQMARTIAERPQPEGIVGRELPVWPLGVIGALSRDEIYDDYQCRC